MAQVKIYSERAHLTAKREALSTTIHNVMVEVLALPAAKRFQRFIGLDDHDFLYPDDRTGAYTIIEISLFEGRDAQTKRRLIEQLIGRVSAEVGLAVNDIEITLFETPKNHWGIRGQVADRLTLDYRVDV